MHKSLRASLPMPMTVKCDEVIHKLRIAERGRIADALPKLKKRLLGAA
jgi:hypothetical protein